MVEENPRPNTRRAYVHNLVLLSRYYDHKKPYREFTREEVLTYLQSYQRTSADDPKEHWVNTYNQKTTILLKVFKWLYNPDMSSQQRKRLPKPDVVRDLPIFRRKEKTADPRTRIILAES